jgi:hypothetical protein
MRILNVPRPASKPPPLAAQVLLLIPGMWTFMDCENRREVLEGRYANYFKVGFNAQEVVIDFGQHHGEEEALMHSRIVICSTYLHTLVKMLEETDRELTADPELRKE